MGTRMCTATAGTMRVPFAGISLKRVQRIAKEQSPKKVAEFICRAAEFCPTQLVSIDEMSKDDRTYARLFGRGPVGARVENLVPFVQKRRLSLLAAVALDEGIIASQVIEGSYTHDEFLQFLEEDLLPEMNPYPGPRSVVMMDNARIHHSEEVTELIESYGMFTYLFTINGHS
ncbi:hypothetical protein D9758_006607 [Tetrapyrgos nigripes]|uniref:Tc1-like transposase DDE domain-containing protein n=1 Tax=Tetrapyrgos nigripes TaxID=182062 RepID=A0A8H5GJI6_9AGAR|nr:hypothetical protein D9758_006607 [Tetrapyrgos nigripes]